MKKQTSSCLIIRALDAKLAGDVEELSFGVVSAFFCGIIVPERCQFRACFVALADFAKSAEGVQLLPSRF